MSTITRTDSQTGTEITIHYEVVGAGKPAIIFHHGSINCIEDWHTLDYVTALQADFQLILVDSRGYGRSSKPDNPKEYSLQSRAEDTIAVLNREGIQTAHCFGASIGAAMCFILAKFYPNRFSSYIFATPYFTLFTEELKTAVKQGMDAFLKQLEKMASYKLSDIPVRDTLLANDAKALWAANSSEWFDYREFIFFIRSPTLIYAGSKEPSLPELTELSKRLDQSSGFKSVLHFFPEMDHGEVYWKGNIVAPVIKHFLQGLKV